MVCGRVRERERVDGCAWRRRLGRKKACKERVGGCASGERRGRQRVGAWAFCREDRLWTTGEDGGHGGWWRVRAEGQRQVSGVLEFVFHSGRERDWE